VDPRAVIWLVMFDETFADSAGGFVCAEEAEISLLPSQRRGSRKHGKGVGRALVPNSCN
jgi:hypothetical protein